MNTAKYKSRLKQVIEDNIGFKMIAISQSLVIVLLAFFVVTADTSEKTIVTPPNYSKPFWVKGGEFSTDYIDQMSRHFVNYLLTYQRSNASYQFDEVLRFAHPVFYATFKAQLASDFDRINRNELGSVFYLTYIDIKKNDAYVEGDLLGSIGQQWLPKKRKYYKISYDTTDGNFFITGFKEVSKASGGDYQDITQEDAEMVDVLENSMPLARDGVTGAAGGNI